MTNEEALKELREWRELAVNRGSYYGKNAIDVYDMAISALESQRWIPVTERLPELIPCYAGTAYSEAVVVITEDKIVCTAVWNGETWIGDFDYWEASGNVTHWKSILPLPPKEEST